MTNSVSRPLQFTPYLRSQPWGARRFAQCLRRSLPLAGRYGESWELSAHPLHHSRVADGPRAGETLPRLWEQHGAEWWGRPAPATFPWLIKYLDCHEFLSVQVHPTDELATRLAHHDGGKTEAWVVLDAEPTARIYAGFRAGVTLGEVTERIAEGTLADCLHSFVPQPGDCIFVPAGTVHAVGGGVLMVEVQQTSDATYRLFDWNRVGLDGRPRPLHHDESLTAIDWAAGPVQPTVPRLLNTDECGVPAELLVSCEYFQWKRYRLKNTATILQKTLSVWILVDGEVVVNVHGEERHLHRGDTVLVPPQTEPLTWTPLSPTTLLRVDPGDASGKGPAGKATSAWHSAHS